jgi:hypothetical protein
MKIELTNKHATPNNFIWNFKFIDIIVTYLMVLFLGCTALYLFIHIVVFLIKKYIGVL